MAEITRARTYNDNVRAAAALKAQRCLSGQGWQLGQFDPEHHAVFYGFQASFRQNLTARELGQLLGWATPFGLDHPGDISRGRASDRGGRTTPAPGDRCVHYPLRRVRVPSSLFDQIRRLAEAYFLIRACALAPLLAQLSDSPLHEQAKTIIRAHVGQARGLPVLWAHLEDFITAAWPERHTDSAIVENTARASIARPFLTALLSGQPRGQSPAQMVADHQQHVPQSAYALGGSPSL